jgi:hypothetical protein
MNHVENISFPFLNSGSTVFSSDMFGSSLLLNDMDLHDMLDDIDFLEANEDEEEESMLLPTSDIVQTDYPMTAYNTSGSTRMSSPLMLSNISVTTSEVGAAPVSAPVFVSSHDLVVVSEQQQQTTRSPWKSIPVTVSSSSVASKAVEPVKPLSLSGYYLATNKNIHVAPIPVSPTGSGRPLIVVTAETTAAAPATAALAALAAKPVVSGETNKGKKRRLSDIPSEAWVSEEEVEMRRYVKTGKEGRFVCRFRCLQLKFKKLTPTSLATVCPILPMLLIFKRTKSCPCQKEPSTQKVSYSYPGRFSTSAQD